MLEGLEIKVVNLLSTFTSTFRLESEYYTSISFNLNDYFSGDDIIDFVQYGTSEELNENYNGYPVLRLNEFDSYFIGTPAKYCNRISKEVYESLKLIKEDILICRTNGNPKFVGKSAIVMRNYDFAYASYLFKIRPKKDYITSATLVSYLNSKYGRLEIEKYSMQGNQSNFSPAKFREIRIPKISFSIQEIITNHFEKSFKILNQSKENYSKAESILLGKLGLYNLTISNKNVNTKPLSDSFLKSGRLDAEYYQPKYDDYLNFIKKNKDGFSDLNTVCTIKDSNYNPKGNIEYKYIELSNIGSMGEVTGAIVDLGHNLPTRARRKIEKGDVIISSIEGSLQSCAIVPEEYDNAICSTGFYVINSQKINSETLLVLFKSELMQNILKQNCSGTILTAINKNEFLNIPVPIIDGTTQEEVRKLVQESFTLKNESERLLQVAKQAVEIAIEQNEDKALEFINKNS